jgi:outer membrane protein OmpA-like peptidoglycan-associated protein
MEWEKARGYRRERAASTAGEAVGMIVSVSVEEHGMTISIQAEALFRTGEHELGPFAEALLEPIVVLLARDDRPITVGAHTDDVGPRLENVALSLRRARSVARFLVARGIDARRVSAEGHGPDEPLATSDSLDGRARNRRVVIECAREKQVVRKGVATIVASVFRHAVWRS